MATTQLTDVIIPEVYTSYTAENSPEKTAIFESGIVVKNSLFDNKANTGGETANLPFWNDIDDSDALISSSNPADIAAAAKLTTGKQIARMAYLNKFYSNSDLASEVAGDDANQHVRNRFGSFWSKQFQKRIIASSNGILADNIANDAGDMVNNVASESIASQSATTKFNREAFTDAVYSMGDAAENLTAMAVHSMVMAQMVKNDDVVYIPDSNGQLTIPTYMGLRIIVDDGTTVTAGSTDGFKYTSILFGSGAFGYGEGSAAVPVEIEREALQGNGGGVEYIGERKSWLLHPVGFQVTGTPVGDSFTLTELAAATSWDRVIVRKSVPLAFLITN